MKNQPKPVQNRPLPPSTCLLLLTPAVFHRLSLRLAVLFCLLFAGPAGAAVDVALQKQRVWHFQESGVCFNNQFSGARVNECTQTGEAAFRILIQPETPKINNSAWYAFEVSSESPQSISVTLAYENGRHRYRPKMSHDGVTWTELDPSTWTHDREANEAVLQLEVGPKPIHVAGQEMIGTRELRDWMERMAGEPGIRKSVIGASMLDQPIEQLEIGRPASRNFVFIIGRQHPPEVTGTLGLTQFVETISGHSLLARKYSRQFRTIVIPLMNPDGVDPGHWRHNTAGVDLNRDWVGFAQPETRAVRDLFVDLARQPGAQPFLLLDFHSTHRDIFYTQEDKHPTVPPDFTKNWLEAIQDRLPDYEMRRSGSHSTNHVTSKAWGYATFGIPSITYEFGDNTDRDLIRQLATVSSEEMMRLLLAEIKQSQPQPPARHPRGRAFSGRRPALR